MTGFFPTIVGAGALVLMLAAPGAGAQSAPNDAFKGAIGGALSGVGFQLVDDAEGAGGARAMVADPTYGSIFGGDAGADYALYAPEFARPVFVKALHAGGEADAATEERLAFIYLNAAENVARTSTIFVFSSEGWSEGAMRWVRAQAAATDGVDVMTLEEFISWANATFR